MSRLASCPAFPWAFSCSRALTNSTVEKKRARLWWCSMAWTPSAVAMWVLPVPGTSNQDDVVCVVEELAAMELADTFIATSEKLDVSWTGDETGL